MNVAYSRRKLPKEFSMGCKRCIGICEANLNKENIKLFYFNIYYTKYLSYKSKM